ncbi:alanine racemase, partial [Rubrimonas sp.]|uniref:alanine racemase n=1 Tax=Rubrimonas sp. TaxID=2036015 RepID=UPI002FDE7594
MDATAALKAEIAETFGTPALVVDLDVVERNVARVQALCDAAGLANRPHVKTHKSPRLARLQLAAGARGIAVQKLGEAEVMADAVAEAGGSGPADAHDILICYNLLGGHKLRRLAALMRRTRLTVAADNALAVDGLAQAAAGAGLPLDVAVECDTGRRRAGVETAAEAVALARRVAASPHLRFAGLLFYPVEGEWAAARALLAAALPALRAEGLSPRMISTGGTPNLAHLGELPGATEHRAGTSIFNDRATVAKGAARPQDCALTVYATVVSRAGPGRGVLDAGSKTLTADTGGGLDGFGAILEHPGARIAGFAEEHGFLDLSACNAPPAVGEVVRVVPNHVCVTVNMVDRLIGVRGGRVVEEIAVSA